MEGKVEMTLQEWNTIRDRLDSRKCCDVENGWPSCRSTLDSKSSKIPQQSIIIRDLKDKVDYLYKNISKKNEVISNKRKRIKSLEERYRRLEAYKGPKNWNLNASEVEDDVIFSLKKECMELSESNKIMKVQTIHLNKQVSRYLYDIKEYKIIVSKYNIIRAVIEGFHPFTSMRSKLRHIKNVVNGC